MKYYVFYESIFIDLLLYVTGKYAPNINLGYYTYFKII